MDKDIMKDLDGLLEASRDVEIGDFENLPDGTYEAYVYACEFTESKAGNLMFKWEFILDGNGKFDNKHHWKYTTLNSPENMKRLVTDLEKFNVDCSSMANIQEQLEEKILDMYVTLTLTSNTKDDKTYVNTSIKV